MVWHAAPRSEGWLVEWRRAGDAAWTAQAAAVHARLTDRDVWSATLPVGRLGDRFEYRVMHGDAVVTGHGRAPAGSGRPVRFAVLADTGDGSESQRSIALRLEHLHRVSPLDFGLIAGDVAYECGNSYEYSRRLYPVFNPETGDALMRSVPLAAAVGNHDTADLRWPLPPFRCSSDYSFFAFWRHPSTRAVVATGPRHKPPRPSAGPFRNADLTATLASALYSFTWGDAHVTVIDSNRYVNWADARMRQWLEESLMAGGASRWRFVVLHHPPFNQIQKHTGDQWTRYFAPIFEGHGVTAVFSGHVHNFQWFGPLRFQPDPGDIARFNTGRRGRMRGELELQADYDGVSRADARWPVYIVTGAGGERLERGGMRPGCPADVIAPAGCGGPPPVDGSTASVTVVDVAPQGVTIRQISASGATLLTRQIR